MLDNPSIRWDLGMNEPYPYARTPMEITNAAMYTLQLYTSGGVGLSSGARAKPPMLTDDAEEQQDGSEGASCE